jgi:hypothetical protein
MTGGEISGNTVSTSYGVGGGVVVVDGSFTMSGGEITGNAASTMYGSGGGVYVASVNTSTIFTMSGGEISGNSAPYGGGVYIYSSAGSSFSKTGGTIYGSNGGDLKNTANTGTGHAVYYEVSPGYYRDTTLGVNDNISTSTLPNSGTEYNWTKN